MKDVITVKAPFVAVKGNERIVSVVIGNNADGCDEIFAKDRADALKAGYTIRDASGSTWRSTEHIVDPLGPLKPSGRREVYTWHEDGMRVRAERVEYHLSPDGERTRTVLRKLWRKF